MVSIIIPVYNVQPYIRECLDSVINQTFREWEAVLIDDGSTDGSGCVCDEYALKDSRFRVIHQENKGLKQVRNIGLQEAKGEFIAWVDSDDVVHPQWLETLYGIMITYQCDVSVVGYSYCSDSPVRIDDIAIKVEDAKLVLEGQAIREMLDGETSGIGSQLWTKLYRKSIVGESAFEFNRAQDLDFNLQLFSNGASIYRILTPLYYYRIRKESITHTYNHSFFVNDMIDRCDIYDHYRAIGKDPKYNDTILEFIYRRLIYAKNYAVCYKELADSTCDDTIEIVFRRTYRDFEKSNDIPWGVKTKVKLLHDYPGLYHLLLKAKKNCC